MLKTGMIIGERYEIVGKIGSGGMADVYKGKDHKLNRYVAVKVLKPEFREDTKFIKKFQTEAQSAAGLTHPNVVNVYDVGNDGGVYYIVMELIEGITLKEYISKKGKLSIKEATSIAIQVSMGLEAAHSHGIVHRDVKPQNIIISTDGKVKVTDFGIARAASSNTISSNAMGSVHYSSPEQVRGGYSDEKSDIYSLGITLYEMVTGVVPFDGDTTVAIAIKHLQEEMIPPSTYTPELPYSLERIIEKCTQKSVDRRYRNMGEVIADLKHSLIDPQGDFVKLASLTNGAQTVIISDSELKKIKDNNVVSAAPSEPESIRTRNEFEDDPYDESYDDGYDDDERHGIHSGLEKAMTIGAWILGAIILCLLILVIGRAAGILNFGSSSNNSNSQAEQSADDQTEDLVEVPDLVGMTEEEAEEALSALGLGRKKSGEEVSDQAEGLISSQDPAAGQQVEKNTTIYYNVSRGEESLTIPDVTNRTQEDAEQILADMGFNVNVTKDYIDNYDTYVEAGYVISTDPAAGTSAKSGDQITILVSRGEDWGDSISVPDVVGMTESEAKLALAKFSSVTVVSEQNSNVTQGEVFAQSLEAYSYVSPDEPITITVSSGNTAPTATPTPTVSNGSGTWKCTQQLAEPEGYQNGRIRLELMQTVNGEPQVSVIVDGEVLEFPYQLDITGVSGVSEGTIYLYEEVGDGDYQLEGQYPVTFEEVDE